MCVSWKLYLAFLEELSTLQHYIKNHKPPVNEYRDGNHLLILLKMEAEILSRPSSHS